MIDVFEKLTGHSEFMELEDNCWEAAIKQVKDFEKVSDIDFKDVYEYWRVSRLENKMPLLW